jgi:acetyl esterase/lipase
MMIDPAQIFDEADIRRARRLNSLLAWMPRYHTGRRRNARLINSAVWLGQALLPSRRRTDISVETFKLASGERHVPMRLLRPREGTGDLLLHFHGGAWVLGNSRLDDGWNAKLARLCNVTVASGDFHLALDDDLERAIEDSVSILEWALDTLPDRTGRGLVIAGESSGAHLAACALIRLATRRRLTEVAGFVSLCGAFDMEGSDSLARSTSSLIIDPKSALQNLDRLARHNPDLDPQDPNISPVLADLGGFPPSVFVAGALDPILDNSIRMHDRCQRFTNRSDLLIVPEAPHGFERLPTRLAAKTQRFIAQWIKKSLAAS